MQQEGFTGIQSEHIRLRKEHQLRPVRPGQRKQSFYILLHQYELHALGCDEYRDIGYGLSLKELLC